MFLCGKGWIFPLLLHGDKGEYIPSSKRGWRKIGTLSLSTSSTDTVMFRLSLPLYSSYTDNLIITFHQSHHIQTHTIIIFGLECVELHTAVGAVYTST